MQEVIKNRSPTFKLRPETERELEQRKRLTTKINSPSPGSYNNAENYDKT